MERQESKHKKSRQKPRIPRIERLKKYHFFVAILKNSCIFATVFNHQRRSEVYPCSHTKRLPKRSLLVFSYSYFALYYFYLYEVSRHICLISKSHRI